MHARSKVYIPLEESCDKDDKGEMQSQSSKTLKQSENPKPITCK